MQVFDIRVSFTLLDMFEDLLDYLSDSDDESYVPSEDEDEDKDEPEDDIRVFVEEPSAQESDSPFGDQHRQTAHLRALCWKSPDLERNTVKIIRFMQSKNMNIPLFLDALSWGSPECTQNRTIMRARSVLMNSAELPDILQRWYTPPRPPGSTNPRPAGARAAIERVANLCVVDIVKRELAALSIIVWNDSPTMTEQDITTVHIKQVTADMQAAAPTLWKLLETMARSKGQEKRNKRKDPDKVRGSNLTIACLLLNCFGT